MEILFGSQLRSYLDLSRVAILDCNRGLSKASVEMTSQGLESGDNGWRDGGLRNRELRKMATGWGGRSTLHRTRDGMGRVEVECVRAEESSKRDTRGKRILANFASSSRGEGPALSASPSVPSSSRRWERWGFVPCPCMFIDR